MLSHCMGKIDPLRWLIGVKKTRIERGKRRSARGQKARGMRGAAPSPPLFVPVERSVLVVEPDPEVQSQMARTLRKRGLRVIGTSSGDGALALVSEWEVDLILVSADLPGRAGVEVTRLIHEACPGAQIVMMAATVDSHVREAARLAGAVGCVGKPLELEHLERWLGVSDVIADAPFDDRPRRTQGAVAE